MKISKVLALAASWSGVAAVPGNPMAPGDHTQVQRRQVTQPWAGASKRGEWQMVTGTLTVPKVDGQDPSRAVAMWVGIDGLSCQNAIWQTGLTFYGDGSIDNWFEWWPVQPQRYSQPFNAKPGDEVRMTVHAWSTTSGNSTLENLTTGQSTYMEVRNMQDQLCLADADWIVEDFEQRSLADFGSVHFSGTEAVGRNGATDPSGSKIVNIVADNRQKTQCSANANGVGCKYVG